MSQAQLILLGGFQFLDVDGGEVNLSAKKAKALLAYLALHAGQPQGREKLATLLWGDSGDEQARQSLRQALTALRRALPGEELIVAEGDQLALPPATLAVDVHTFEQWAAQSDIEPLSRALRLYQGELLEGLATRAEVFDDWLMVERTRLRDVAMGIMERLLQAYLQQGQLEALQGVASRLLTLDPLREPVHRMLMECLAKRGRYGAALKQYRQCRRALQRELGVGPEAATERLYDQIMAWRTSAPAEDVSPAITATAAIADRCADDPSGPAPAASTEPSAPQLRQAVVLVVRVEDLAGGEAGPEPETLCRLLGRYYEVVDGEIASQGGCILSHFSDLVVGAFGVPHSHDEDARSALLAAAALRDKLPALLGEEVKPRLALACGQVLMSELGSHHYRQFSLVGQAVSQAEELSGRASAGQLLATDSYYRTVAELADAEPAEPGKVWRIVRLHDGRSVSRPMVGRRRELRQLSAALEDCRDTGHGEAFLIRGEAGIGKSRLLGAGMDLARGEGFAVFTVAYRGFGTRGALERQRLTGGLVQMLANGEPQRLVEQGMLRAEQQALLLELLGLPLSPECRALLQAMDADAHRRGTQAVVSELLIAASRRQPLLLAVEDIHWADRESLSELAQWGTLAGDNPMLLIMTSRVEGEPLQPGWRGAMQGAALTTFDLACLRPEELLALVDESNPAPERLQRCLARSGGNPFFFIQLMQDACDEGEVPDSVQASVLARLDRLDTRDRGAMQAAAVLGYSFSAAALRHLLDDPDYQLAPLSRCGLLRPDADNLLFSHALIQESIYTALLKAQRRHWHLKAADWFAGRDAVLHAEHLDRAAAAGAAEAYLLAARALAARYQPQQALRLLARGLELAKGEQCYELARLRGELLRDGGEVGQAIQAFELAYRCAPDEVSRGQALWGKASCLHLRDQYRLALTILAQAEAGLPVGAAIELRAWIAYLKGNVLFPTGDIKGCLASHQQALAYAQQCRSPELEARALSGLADAWYMSGKMLTAHDYFNRCVELSRSQGFTRIEVGNLSMRGLTAFYLNRPADAITDASAGIELARRIGHRRAELGGHIVIAMFYLMKGELGNAEQHNREGMVLARQLGSRRFQGDCLLGLADVLDERGETQQAETLLEQAITLSGEDKAYMGPWLLGTLARITSDQAKRRAALEEAEQLLAGNVVAHNYFHFYENAIYGAIRHREWREAKRYADALADYTADEPLPWTGLIIRMGRLVAEMGMADRNMPEGQPERTASLRALLEELRQQGYLRGMSLLKEVLPEQWL